MKRKEKYDPLLPIIPVALVAAVALLILTTVGYVPYYGEHEKIRQENKITGAAIGSSQLTVFEISAGDTSGKIKWKNLDGKTISLPIAADGTAVSGSSATEAVFLATDTKNKPEDLLYLEGETCAGAAAVTDCLNAQFLVIENKKAHLFKITNINTDKNEIDIEDRTYEKESNNNAYAESAATTIIVGDIQITLTINEAAKQITFASIGSSNNALIELYDKATLEIINTNLASSSFEGVKFSEYNDGALAPEKYIGKGGTAPLTMQIFFDDASDLSIEISNNLLTDLTKTHGSGWYTTDGEMSFYSNKGTLFTYEEVEKHSLTIGHVVSLYPTKKSVAKKTEDQLPTGWTMYGVDKEGDVGKDSAFVLDNDGYAHISYFDETNDALKYAYETREGWYVQILDRGDVGRASDIALESQQYPHIVYTDNKNNKLKYGWYDGKDWHKVTLEDLGENAILPALALDSKNRPHIAYYNYIDDNLMYAWFDGTIWHIEIVDEEGDVGTDASIALDSNDDPHISYFDNNYDLLKYAWYDGEEWHIQELDTAGNAGLFSAISLDAKSYPTIWYYNQLQGKVQYLQYLGDDVWDQETFSLEGFDLYQGDIVLDNKGYVHFSYYWEAEKDLRYAVGQWE